ncbi:MAG: hypothetical protein H7328_10765 [Bdellovibrio sp.]|nr:hypothetical protein [Bdellovibrio sp.]
MKNGKVSYKSKAFNQTVVDLVRYVKKSAGLSHVATVILEMKDKINAKKLPAIAEIHNDTPLVQRVGYLLEKFGGKSEQPLLRWLKNREVYLVKLNPSLKVGKKNIRKWAINLNSNVEPDEV